MLDQNLSNLYSISKTYQIELKPDERSMHWISAKGIITADQNRLKHYPRTKYIFDLLHQKFIQVFLENFKPDWEQYINNINATKNKVSELKDSLADEAKGSKKSESTRKKIFVLNDALKKDVKLFETPFKRALLATVNEVAEGRDIKKPEALFNAIMVNELPDIDQEEKERLLEVYEGYAFYFDRYCHNRELLFTCENKFGTILNRLITNIHIFRANLVGASRIDYTEEGDASGYIDQLSEHIARLEDIQYQSVTTYSGINKYNSLISTINSVGNLAFSANVIDKPLKLKKLENMILANVEYNDLSSQSVNDTVKHLSEQLKTNVRKVVAHLANFRFYQSGMRAEIFVSRKNLNKISDEWTGSWHLLGDVVSAYKKKADHYALSELSALVQDYELQNETKLNVKPFHEFLENKFKKLMADLEESEAVFTSSVDLYVKTKSNESCKRIQHYCQAANDLQNFIRLFNVDNNNGELSNQLDPVFYELVTYVDETSNINKIYNQIRNIITKKFSQKEMVPLFFDAPAVLSGWDLFKEKNNKGIILKKDGRYYLGIFQDKGHLALDYIATGDDSKSKIEAKSQLAEKVLASDAEPFYEKRVCKYLKDSFKFFPKVFIKPTKAQEFYGVTDRILTIYTEGLFKGKDADKKATQEYISFLIECLKKHPDWPKYFDFSKLKKAEDYRDYADFTSHVDTLCYSVRWDRIKVDYIDSMVDKGSLLLFKLHNRDLAMGKTINKMAKSTRFIVSSIEDKDDVMLQGGASVLYRKALIDPENAYRHKAGEVMKFRTKENTRGTKFKKDIIKDRRYTYDKFYCHLPVKINYKQTEYLGKYKSVYNRFYNSQLTGVPYIIGISRGENHLMYYTVIDPKGQVVEQKSLNIINGIDYKSKLRERSKKRDAQRKSWKQIEQIKNLKEGYVSSVVEEITKLVKKYNCFIALEDMGIKSKKRAHIEHAVYQGFEMALVKKLGCFLDKETSKIYQLCPDVQTIESLKFQYGAVLFVLSYGIGNIDPVTGYNRHFYLKYKNLKTAKADLAKNINSIEFDAAQNLYEISYDAAGKSWVMSSKVRRHVKTDRGSEPVNVTNELKRLFIENDVSFMGNENIINEIIKADSLNKQFFIDLFRMINLIAKCRNVNYQYDDNRFMYFESPIKPFFSTLDNNFGIADTSDAVESYNIAIRGLLTARKIISEDGNAVITSEDHELAITDQ